MATPGRKKREKKNVAHGIAHIKSSFNNTIISITDQQGNVISWASAGNVGFKGSRKSTPFAAQTAAEQAARKAMDHGLRRVDVHVTGPGSGRETAIRSLQNIGIEVTGIKDVTPVPHNGCRLPTKRSLSTSAPIRRATTAAPGAAAMCPSTCSSFRKSRRLDSPMA